MLIHTQREDWIMSEHEPRVWLGCLACYNAGRLVGEWMPPEEAAIATPESLHREPADALRLITDKRDGFGDHEELWVMDHEYVPISGEFGLLECQAIADAFERVGEYQWEAYLAYADTGLGSMDGSGISDPSDFEEAFGGHWESFRSYADDWAEEQMACMTPRNYAGKVEDNGLTEFMGRYFDWAAHARDLEMNMTTSPASDGGVFIFRSY